MSEELTASFRGEPQAVHVLCYGIDADDHEWLQRQSHDVEACAGYLHEHDIACALAHPSYVFLAGDSRAELATELLSERLIIAQRPFRPRVAATRPPQR